MSQCPILLPMRDLCIWHYITNTGELIYCIISTFNLKHLNIVSVLLDYLFPSDHFPHRQYKKTSTEASIRSIKAVRVLWTDSKQAATWSPDVSLFNTPGSKHKSYTTYNTLKPATGGTDAPSYMRDVTGFCTSEGLVHFSVVQLLNLYSAVFATFSRCVTWHYY